MYDPILIPEDIDPKLAERLRQYVLTAGEVASALNVTQQAVAFWVKQGTIDVLIEAGKERATNRFSLEGVVTKANETGRAVHVYALPMRLLTDFDVTPLTEGRVECIYVPPKGAPVVEWISESEAAKVVGVQRSTLRNHRVANHLNTEIRTRPHPSPTVHGVQYYVDDVKAVHAGTMPLYREPAHA